MVISVYKDHFFRLLMYIILLIRHYPSLLSQILCHVPFVFTTVSITTNVNSYVYDHITHSVQIPSPLSTAS